MRFEQENNINYMVIDANEEQEKTYDIKMLEKNKIEGLLPMQLRQINNSKMYYYNISSKQQLTQLFRYTSICWEDLKMICDGIAQLVKSVNEYMLDLNNVFLEPECVYADISRRRLYFTYCSRNVVNNSDYEDIISDNNFERGLKLLFEYVLERFDHETEKSKLMQVYGLYQNIVQKDYNAENLWGLVSNDEIKSDKKETEIIDCYDDSQNSNEGNNDSIGYETSRARAAETFRIDDVPCEDVGDEEEVVNNLLVNICKFVKAGAFVSVAGGLLRLLLPQFMPIKISGLTAVICIVCGAAVYLLISKIPKASMVKLEHKAYKQPYEVELNKSIGEASMMGEDLKDNEVSGKAEEEGYTMLMSDYLEIARNKSICLRFVKDESASEFEGQDFNISKFPCIIGSLDEKCDVIIDNDLISRVHTCITMEDGYYYIEDMNSTNGTYVNESRVKGTCRQKVNIDDEIRLAGFVYKLEKG